MLHLRSDIIASNNKIFFITTNASDISALWVSDGTDAGTVKLKDSLPYTNYNLTDVSGTVFFFLSHNPQLWKTDGTITNTVLVKDFSTSASSPYLSASANNLFFFTIWTYNNGQEVWRSDGTETGTFMVKDINPFNNYTSNGPAQLTPFDNKLYFKESDSSANKLWYTDGTEAGTVKVNGQDSIYLQGNYEDNYENRPFAILGNALYFSAFTSTTGTELFKYTPAKGISLVEDISPGSAGGDIENVVTYDKSVAFTYGDTITKAYELWTTKGAAANTTLVQSFGGYSSYFTNLAAASKTFLYFDAYTAEAGWELWRTDGTPQNTAMVKDIYAGATSSYPSFTTALNDKMFFCASSKTSGTELWQADLKTNKAGKLKEINSSSSSSSIPTYFQEPTTFNGNMHGVTLNNTLYYIAGIPETGYELYKSDGTGTGTTLVKDFYAGEISSQPKLFLEKNNAVYFILTSPPVNIYKIDSTGTLTTLTTAQAGITSYDIADNGLIFYTCYDGQTQKYELWRTDGTVHGNYMLTDKLNSNSYVRTSGTKAYFAGYDATTGTELWMSNGTVAGTRMIKDISQGVFSSFPFSFYPYNGYMFFGATDFGGINPSLWRSDGSSAGTFKIKDITPYGSNPTQNYNDHFCIINDTLFLSANGSQLWKSDGTETGTVLIKDFQNFTSGIEPSYLTNVNGTLFFAAQDSALWKSDGTAAGTLLVKNITYDGYYIFTQRCTADGKFFFNTNGLLWVSDGTDTGTHIVSEKKIQDVTSIDNLNAAGNIVFFSGYDYKYGNELYAGDATKVPGLKQHNESAIKKQSTLTAIVLQNPILNSLKLQVQSPLTQTTTLIITDISGNIISQQKYNLNKGNNLLSIDCINWRNGMYIVHLTGTKGEAISLNVLK